jgi:hypothetical protein
VKKINETHYSTIDIRLGHSLETVLAFYISILIALIICIPLPYVLKEALFQAYWRIMTQVNSTTNYSIIEKKEDSGSVQPLMNYTPEVDKLVTKTAQDNPRSLRF